MTEVMIVADLGISKRICAISGKKKPKRKMAHMYL